jgi:hypothetical protein
VWREEAGGDSLNDSIDGLFDGLESLRTIGALWEKAWEIIDKLSRSLISGERRERSDLTKTNFSSSKSASSIPLAVLLR